MLEKTKYIRTENDEIIVFGTEFQHSYFKNKHNPKSAGFIQFYKTKNGHISCHCYGESISLNLKSHEDDTYYAKRQILALDMYDAKDEEW